MSFLLLKALHIVAVVAWFAGLFYGVRLFVYLTEAHERPESERAVLLPVLELMARRLWYGIAWPAGIAAVGLGLALLQWYLPLPGWLLVKLHLAGLLVAYHLTCTWLLRRLLARRPPWSSRALRIWNEVATVLLVAIVFAVVVRQAIAPLWGAVGTLAFALALLLGIVGYGRVRST